jgi:hypothetical protein
VEREFYVSFGADQSRRWDEAIQYGFLSGGGGTWYSNSLRLLGEGDRIWVKIPGRGFVGVGRVRGPRVAAKDFTLDGRPALDVLQGNYHREFSEDPEDPSISCQWNGCARSRKPMPFRNSACSATRTRSASRSHPDGERQSIS